MTLQRQKHTRGRGQNGYHKIPQTQYAQYFYLHVSDRFGLMILYHHFIQTLLCHPPPSSKYHSSITSLDLSLLSHRIDQHIHCT